MLSSVQYFAPRWASSLRIPPARKLRLGHFPTPIYPFSPPGLPHNVSMYIKREDFSGFETSGNKMRKLEFIFQDVLERGADCVVTCGGVQSNHCRATAITARMLGLESYLLLRTNKPDSDPGLVGNLLFDRLVGAGIIQMSRQEYARHGSEAMIARTCERLRDQGRRPYPIPVGGSNGIGTWGYVQAIDEIHAQLLNDGLNVSDIAFACGSGGTAAGLGIGSYLYAEHKPHTTSLSFRTTKIPVHAYIVCDNPEYFYEFIDNNILPEMGLDTPVNLARKVLQITNAQGLGYAMSSNEELAFIVEVARTTGVVLDPVYSGKALFHLVRELRYNPDKFAGQSVLFVHTGGQYGLYDKSEQVQEYLIGGVQRLEM